MGRLGGPVDSGNIRAPFFVCNRKVGKSESSNWRILGQHVFNRLTDSGTQLDLASDCWRRANRK